MMEVDTKDLHRNVAVHERFQIGGMNRAHNVMSNGLIFFLALLYHCLSSYLVISSSKGFIPKQGTWV